MSKEPLRGLHLDLDPKTQQYKLVFGPISGDLYDQLNTKVALLVYSGKYTRRQIDESFRKGGKKIRDVDDIYEWYSAEGKKAWRFDWTRPLRVLLVWACDKAGIVPTRVKIFANILVVKVKRIKGTPLKRWVRRLISRTFADYVLFEVEQ